MTRSKSEETTPLADRFLMDARETQVPVSLYLVSGFQLKGEIIEFDEASILFHHKNNHQLVLRSAVASMYPIPKDVQDAEDWWRKYVSQGP